MTEKKQPKKKKNKNHEFPINKYWFSLLIETIYIYLAEIVFKIIWGSFSFDYSLLRIFLSSVILSLLITTITNNLGSKLRKTILIIFNFCIALYAWLQIGFMNYLGSFMSIGNAEQGTRVTDYIKDFLLSYNIKSYLLYLPFIGYIVYLIFEKKILKEKYTQKICYKSWIHDLIWFVSLILLITLYYLTISLSFMESKYQSVSNKDLFSYPSSPSLAIKNYGTTVYLILDIKSTILGTEEVYAVTSTTNYLETQESTTRIIDDTAWETLISEEEDTTLNTLNNYFISRNITETNEYTGIFEGKNVIVVMLESIGTAVFDEAYKDYFPTLYKLYSEGITAVNNYSPRNNCATGESEMTAQLSLYSISTVCTVNTYRNNYYPEALLSVLSENGYYTSSYHDYTDKYYYRSIYEYNMGSTKYYGVTDLGMSYNSLYKEWPSDQVFMEEALDEFIDEGLFASMMITVTAHTPYSYSSEMGDLYVSLFEDLDVDKATKRYLSKVKVVDLALETLLTTLEEAGKLDDTVLVLFGDHYPYGLTDSQYQSIASWDISINQEVDRTPFIIYNSETEGMEITKYTSPLDITPTLLNLLGIEYDPRYYLGNDIFDDGYEDIVLFPDNSWLSSKGFYDATKGEFISSDANASTMTDDEIIAMNTYVSDLRNMSGLAIKKNYFKYLFEYFDEYYLTHEEEVIEESSEEVENEMEEST